MGNEPRQLGEIGNRAIVIRSRDEVENACRRVRSGGGHLVPLLDTSGMKLSGVDEAVATEAYPEAALSIIHEFEKRRARLAVWIRESSRPEVRLLAFMYVHGRELTARYDPGNSKGFSYGAFLPEGQVDQLAQRLCAAGYLHATYFDCFNACSSCSSSRLNVREECPVCRASDVHDVRLIHHFRCANLAPEDDFQAPGEKLICRKCSRELRHYGSDHESAGNAVKCVSCGYTGSEPAVGFVCLDCGTHTDSALVRKRRVHHYRLSEAAIHFLQSADPEAIISDSVLGTSIPLGLLQHIRAACARNDQFVVAEVLYRNENHILLKSGVKHFTASRAHFRSMLASQISGYGHVVAGPSIDYVFIPELSEDQAMQRLKDAVARSNRTLKRGLDPELRLFDKADLVT